jgi:hypothetical protein
MIRSAMGGMQKQLSSDKARTPGDARRGWRCARDDCWRRGLRVAASRRGIAESGSRDRRSRGHSPAIRRKALDRAKRLRPACSGPIRIARTSARDGRPAAVDRWRPCSGRSSRRAADGFEASGGPVAHRGWGSCSAGADTAHSRCDPLSIGSATVCPAE